MGLHNALRNYATLTAGIKRAMGMEGDDEGTSRLGETLTPVLDPFALPEHALHRGERLCAYSRAQGGVAAQYTSIGLRNPAGSGHLVVMESAHIICGTGVNFGYRPNSTVDATLGGLVRDTRWGVAGALGFAVAGTLVHRTQAGDPLTAHVLESLQTNIWHLIPFVLAPGYEVLFLTGAVNNGLTVSMLWRERPMMKSELAK